MSPIIDITGDFVAQRLFEIVSIHLTLLLMENCVTLEQISREQIIQR